VTEFKDLGLNPSILAALTQKGYSQPTPIQLAAIPGVMEGRDLLGIAQTGTGKTAAFALPILHRLAANRKAAPRYGCRALVLSPTRELATQIADNFKAYGSQMGFSVATIFGGVGHGPQRQALARGVDIIVAAPGRLLDHLGEDDADLSQLEIFVLDEADQMLDMGFIVPIRQIVKHLPKKRQNLFFSATMPTDIEKLANDLLNPDPLKVSVAPPSTTVERINQQVVFVEAGRKRGLLAELFAKPEFSRVLVFTRTKRGADKVARILEGGGVPAVAIHGNKSQAQRERALAEFKAGKVRALVATDIAARGIDISAVSHVVQYELPEVPEQYVHRIGRTARAGKDGSAVAFCAEDERQLLRDIERTTRQKIPSTDRRNDAALAQLSANANEDEKRSRGGARAESRGAPQPRRQQQPRRDDQRRDQRQGERSGEHRQHEPRAEGAAQGEGRQGRRRGGRGNGGGQGAHNNGQARDGQRNGERQNNPNAQKPRGQKSQGHRKGQNREQGAARGDVMKVNAGAPNGKVMGADALVRHIGSTNPWSKS
jgi:ATP-dependent RNA helicase RhlE